MKFIITIFLLFIVSSIMAQQPPCGNNPQAGNTCQTAVSICDLDGYCGNTSSSTYSVNSWSSSCGFLGLSNCGLTGEFCGSIENNSFIKFTASGTTVDLGIWVGNCTTNEGIQIMVFDSEGLCSGDVNSYYCNYQFYPSATIQSITVNNLVVGEEYYLMVDGFAGDVCDYAFVANSGIGLPVSVSPTETTVCIGETVTLTASGGDGVYTWDASPDLSSTSGASVSATPTTPGVYTYTVNSDDPSGCSSESATATITVENCGCPLTTSNSGSVCIGESFDLTATLISGNMTSYSWSGPNGFTSVDQNPTGITPPATAGAYNYMFTATIDGVECISTTTVTVVDCPEGCDILAIKDVFTNEGFIELDACVSECSMYFLNPQSMTGSESQAYAESLGANLVSIQSQEENDCLLAALNAIGQTGIIWIGLNDEAVEGEFVWYDQSPVTYTNWATGEPNNSGGNEDCVQIYPTGSEPGKWNDLPCDIGNSKSIIEVNLCPVVNAGPNITICEGDTAVMQSSETILGSAPYTYEWSDGTTTYQNSVAPNVTTEYILQSEDRYGCKETDTMTVIVTPLPAVNVGEDITICQGENVVLNTTGSGSWNNNVESGVPFYPNTTQDYIYTVTVNECVSSDTLTVYVNPKPNAGVSPSDTTGCGSLTVNFTNLAQDPSAVYTIDFGDGNSNQLTSDIAHHYSQSGCYDVTVVADLDGCITSTLYPNLICVIEPPIADFLPNPAVLSIVDSETMFINNSQNANNYNWNFGDGSAFSTEHSPIHTFPDDEGGTYIVTLVAEAGDCRDTAKAIVEVEGMLIYYIPNSFTPDGDSYNPTFKPVFTAGYDVYNYSMYIYNRWGELIFESHDAEVGWDGTYGESSEVLIEGTYVWKIDFKTTLSDERKTLMGHVNLLR